MPADAKVVVVTGLSGAGKSTALRALTDLGFYCVDNLPPGLAADTVTVCDHGGIKRVALGMDVRVGAFLDTSGAALSELHRQTPGLVVLYLDAADEALVRRFHETRRPHPILAATNDDGRGPLSVLDGVKMERERLASIRSRATMVVDTSRMSVHELRRHLVERFGQPDGLATKMQVQLMSFGFKYGVPLDANLVFDVRFLENPYFDPNLRDMSGHDRPVIDFVMSSDGCAELLAHLESLLLFSLPRYEHEGKSYLTVAIGCTGGRHRSVALADEIAQRVDDATGQRVGIVHRDISRGGILEEVTSSPGRRGRWTSRAPGSDDPGEGQ